MVLRGTDPESCISEHPLDYEDTGSFGTSLMISTILSTGTSLITWCAVYVYLWGLCFDIHFFGLRVQGLRFMD